MFHVKQSAGRGLGVDLIAIDGPSGVGKSSVSKGLAARLGYYFLSSGMIYRAMAWHLLHSGWNGKALPAADWLQSRLAELAVQVGAGGAVSVNGKAPGGELGTEQVSRAASLISTVPAVRERSNAVQRETVRAIAQARNYPGVILEGRDIGTVVFPDAPHKFFLTARDEVRAQRRFKEYQQPAAGGKTQAQTRSQPGPSLEAVQAALQQRDERDSSRDIAPLRPADDARIVDTSELDLEAVIARLLEEIAARQ